MITDVLTNPTVKAAIEALQKGDRKAWSALFEADAKLYDDGRPRPLQKFTDDALGHERFTSIDRVENDGLDIIGAFHSDRGATSGPISGFSCRRRARSNVLISGRPINSDPAVNGQELFGVAARNPAMTMAAMTVNQMSSGEMTEIISVSRTGIGSPLAWRTLGGAPLHP